MPPAALEPISPELVLVCPELAAAARAALPDGDLDASIRRASVADAPPGATGASPLRVCASVFAYTAASLSALALWSAFWVIVVALLVTVPLLF